MTKTTVQRSVTYVNNTTPSSITTKEIDLDTCFKNDEIVVEIHSASLNPVDSIVHSVASKWIVSSGLKTYSRDYAGVIVRKGPLVDPKWQIGDKVNGFYNHLYGERGTLSDYLIVNPMKQAAISHLNNIEAIANDDNSYSNYNQYDLNASYPLVFGTAYDVLFRQGQIWGPESKILVNGASTQVSNCFIQIAKNHLKIGTVVGICNSKSIDYNKKMGFDYLIPYDQPNKLSKVESLIKDEFNGEKFDLIFDSVGTSEYFPIMDRFLKPKAENSYYVTIAGDNKIKYTGDLSQFFNGLKTVAAPFRQYNPMRKYNFLRCFVKQKSDYMELAAVMIKNGTFKPQMDSIYEFEDYEKALDRLNSNRAKGKIIVRVKDE